MYPVLRPILNKGGAGRSLGRAETVERLNPIVRQHARLLHAYDDAIRSLADRQLAQRLEEEMPRMRTEFAKLREVILSNDGAPHSGVDLAPGELDLGTTDGDLVNALNDRERAYRDTLEAELDDRLHHSDRPRAVLSNNLVGSETRLGVLYPVVSRMPRRRADRVTAPEPIDRTTDVPVDIEHTDKHAHGPQPAIAYDQTGPIEPQDPTR